MTDILLATFNGEKYIRQQLESILNQTNQDWKLIIRDDGSEDATVSIIRDYTKRYPEKLVFVNDTFTDSVKTGSAKACFMKLLSYSDSEYVMFSDQDDVWDDDKVDITLKRLENLELVNGVDVPLLVHTDLRVVDSELKVTGDSFLELMNLPKKKDIRNIIVQNSIVGCTMAINACLRSMLLQLSDTTKLVMHDHVAAIIAQTYGSISLIDRQTVSYRQHEENSVGAADTGKLSYKIKRLFGYKKQYAKDMKLAYNQVGYILSVLGSTGIEAEKLEMMNEFSSLSERGRLNKICFFLRYRVLRKGFFRNLIMLIWS